MLVRVAGLVTRYELNGLAGRLVAADVVRGRWKVQMEDGSGLKLFRQENLTPVEVSPGAAALASGPETLAIDSDSDEPPPLEEVPWPSQPPPHRDPSTSPTVESRPVEAAAVDPLPTQPVASMAAAWGSVAAASEHMERASAAGQDAPAERTGLCNRPAGTRARAGGPVLLQGAQLPSHCTARLRRLRPGMHVVVLPDTKVEDRAAGSASADAPPEHTGVCQAFDFATGQWQVRMADRVSAYAPERLSPAPVALRPGAYVRICAAEDKPELDGRVGMCQKVEEGTGLWQVQLEVPYQSGGFSYSPEAVAAGTGAAPGPSAPAAGAAALLHSVRGEDLELLENYVPPAEPHDTLAALLGSGAAAGGADRPRGNPRADATFCNQLEDLLISGDIQWMDC